LIALFLCDYTGVMAKPWIDAGYECWLVDPQHPDGITRNGNLVKIGLTVEEAIPIIREHIDDVVFVGSFPVCTDLAVSGAAHFKTKYNKDKHFQAKAMQLVWQCHMIGELSGAPYFIENPVSVIASAWRKPDYVFHPYEYGGYLPEDDVHPLYSEYIKPRDAYPKKTCLWTGNGFVMPEKKPVPVDDGYSTQFHKLGGKSLKTKNIRSATPRGFAQAVFEVNQRPSLDIGYLEIS